jgi:hypothetical protein
MTAQRASLLILAITAATIYFLRLDNVAGLIADDAWYILLAKAIANGDGYRLISSATQPFVPTAPPGFPIALAPVFLFSPSYPDNLLLLKMVSVLAMFGVGAACWFDFTRHREIKRDQAVWLSLLVIVAPPFVFLATSTVMAECLFTFVQLLAILAIENASRDRQEAPMRVVGAAVLAAMAVLIRTAGLALVVAAIAYFVMHRQWRRALITTATVTVCLLPWQIYSSLGQSPLEERAVHSATITYSYSELLAMARPGSLSTTVSAADWLTRAAANVSGILTRDVGATILPEVFRASSESGEEVVSVGAPGRGSMGSATGTMLLSALFALVMLLGVIRTRAWFELPFLLIAASIGMIAAVGAETYRYVLPLMPFLLLYFLRGLVHPSAARIAVLCLVGLHGMDHAMYLRDRAAGASSWIADAREIDEVLSWMHDNIQGAAAIASTNPGLVYLRTGRKGVGSGEPLQNWEKWRAAGVRYVVALRPIELPPPSLNGKVVFRSSHGRLWIVEM